MMRVQIVGALRVSERDGFTALCAYCFRSGGGGGSGSFRGASGSSDGEEKKARASIMSAVAAAADAMCSPRGFQKIDMKLGPRWRQLQCGLLV